MTSWTSDIAAFAKDISGAPGGWSETVSELAVNGTIRDKYDAAKLIALYQGCTGWGVKIHVRDVLQDSVIPDAQQEEDLVGQRLAISISKERRNGVYPFFTLEGFRNGLRDPELETHATHILIAESFAEFSSKRCKIGPWKSPCLTGPEHQHEEITLARLIRTNAPEVLPRSLSFWIPSTAPKSYSQIFEAWESQAARRLLPVFSSEIWVQGADTFEVVLAGPRKRTASWQTRHAIQKASRSHVFEAVKWFAELPRESEVRHSLLVKRLAVEWPDDSVSWETGLERALNIALEGARTDYKAHLHETTTETLKAMADLRKALNEETSKIIERTQNLSTALFRDIALAVAAIGLRLVYLDAKSTGQAASNIFLLVAALWLATSFYLTTSTNRKFFRLQARIHASWHRRIHPLIPGREFLALAKKPIKAAVKNYNRTRILVSVVYGLAIGSLVITAIFPYVSECVSTLFKALTT